MELREGILEIDKRGREEGRTESSKDEGDAYLGASLAETENVEEGQYGEDGEGNDSADERRRIGPEDDGSA